MLEIEEDAPKMRAPWPVAITQTGYTHGPATVDRLTESEHSAFVQITSPTGAWVTVRVLCEGGIEVCDAKGHPIAFGSLTGAR